MKSEWSVRSLLWWNTITPWHFTRTIHETILPVRDWSAWFLHAPLELKSVDLSIVVQLFAYGGLFVENRSASVVTGSIGNVTTTNIANALVIKRFGSIIYTLLVLSCSDLIVVVTLDSRAEVVTVATKKTLILHSS